MPRTGTLYVPALTPDKTSPSKHLQCAAGEDSEKDFLIKREKKDSTLILFSKHIKLVRVNSKNIRFPLFYQCSNL